MKPDTHSADPQQRARVLVVENHAVVRAGLVSLLAADSGLEVFV
jgi:hypothetical protein